jgi:hypothetical protein
MLKLNAEVEAVEAGKIGRMVEDAEGQFDGAGTADADAEEMAGLFLDELANGGGHIVEDGQGAIVEAGGKVEVVESLALGSDGGDAEVGASEVNADGEGLHDDGRLLMIREGWGVKNVGQEASELRGRNEPGASRRRVKAWQG